MDTLKRQLVTILEKFVNTDSEKLNALSKKFRDSLCDYTEYTTRLRTCNNLIKYYSHLTDTAMTQYDLDEWQKEATQCLCEIQRIRQYNDRILDEMKKLSDHMQTTVKCMEELVK